MAKLAIRGYDFPKKIEISLKWMGTNTGKRNREVFSIYGIIDLIS